MFERRRDSGLEVPLDLSRRITLLSFVMACLIVFIHVPRCVCLGWEMRIEAFMHGGICRIAVPFFFCVSGYMIARHARGRGWWVLELKKRIRTVLVPYCIWCLLPWGVGVAETFVANVFAHAPLFRNMGSLPDVISVFGLSFVKLPHYSVQLWYLRALLLLLLITPPVVYLLRRNPCRAIGILVVLYLLNIIACSYVHKGDAIEVPIRYLLPAEGAFYFFGGIFLYDYEVKVDGMTAGALIVIGVIALIGLAVWNPIREGLIALVVGLIHCCAVLGLLVGVWCWTPASQLPQALSNLSFPIFLIHYLVIRHFEMILPLGFVQSLTGFFVVGILTIIVSGAIGYVLIRYFPRIASVAFGGRVK